MEPDRSSRAAARRIVEEVLADHAARATALDGATPVTIVERPDTPSWRAARRIVEETLAEHAGRVVVPPTTQVEVLVDLEEQDIEVVVVDDEHASTTEPRSEPATSTDPSEPDVVSIVAPIEPDETPAKAARRVVEVALVDHGVDPEVPTDPAGAPIAFEVDPVPAAPPEPPEPPEPLEPVTTRPDPAVADAAETPGPPAVDAPGATEGPDDVDGADDADDAEGPVDEGPSASHDDSASDEADRDVVIPIDDTRLRAAIPERLFTPDPEPTDPEPTDAALAPPVEPSAVASPEASSPVDGPPPRPRPRDPDPPSPPDPDAPTAIAARIVADVLADRERAAREAHDAELEAELAGAELPEEAGTLVTEPEPGPELEAEPEPEPEPGSAVAEDLEVQPSGPPDGWTMAPSASERLGPESPSGVMTMDAGVEDLQVLDPVAPDPDIDGFPEQATDEFWAEQDAALPETEDEFGGWPDPIAPPRRTGRWLITTVIGAVALALLLPLAIGALRDLVSFS